MIVANTTETDVKVSLNDASEEDGAESGRVGRVNGNLAAMTSENSSIQQRFDVFSQFDGHETRDDE